MPGVDSACLHALHALLEAFAQPVGEHRVGLVLDGSGAHTAQTLAWPERIGPLRLPPYAPELNPVELTCRRLRADLPNRIYADLADLEAALAIAIQPFWDAPATLQRRTGFDWWLKSRTTFLP